MAVGAEDAGRPRRADAVGVQENHDCPHRLLLGPALDDAGGALAADALDFRETGRLGLDDLEHGLAETGDDALGHHRADAAHLPRGKVTLDALDPRGRGHLERVGTELEAVLAIRDPSPRGRQPLPGGDRGSVAHHRHEVVPAAGVNFQDAEARLGAVERHPLDRAGKHVERGGAIDGGGPEGLVHALASSGRREAETLRRSMAEPQSSPWVRPGAPPK